MGCLSVPSWIKLFSSASVCVLSAFGVSLVLEGAESLRMFTTSRLFPKEGPRPASHEAKKFYESEPTSDLSFAAVIQRHNFGLGSPAHPLVADVPSALSSMIPLFSSEGEGDFSKPPALSIVDLGLFDLINPLPENKAKSLDLSWLAHVVREAETSRGTKLSTGISETESNHADGKAAGAGKHAVDEGERRKTSLPNSDESGVGVPSDAYQTVQHGNQRWYSGGHIEDVNSGSGVDPTSTTQKKRKEESFSGSLAEAIEAKGDKNLIEEAGLEGKNPWQLIDEADKRDRQRREEVTAGRKPEGPPAGQKRERPRAGVGRTETFRRTPQGAKGPAPPKQTEPVAPERQNKADSTGVQTESGVFVGNAIKVDARFLYEGTAGPLNVQYGPDAAKLERVVVVENTSSEHLRVFARTLGATFTPEPNSRGAESRKKKQSNEGSFLEYSASFLKQTFLQMTTLVVPSRENQQHADVDNPVLASVDDILEEFRQSREDRPGKSSELLINLVDEDDLPSENVLETEKGVQIINDLRQLMQKLFGQRKRAVQVMKAVGVVILSFPSEEEIVEKVKEVVEFVRQSFDGYMTRWSFAREVTVMSESSKNYSPTTGLGGASKPSEDDDRKGSSFHVENLPDDPELQKKLYGMFMTNMSSAWLHGEKGDGVVAAILDTGVSSHPDLECNFWVNSQEQQDGTDSDGNGLSDDVRGYNFDAERGDPDDENGHGTHVAGIIGACANSSGTVGGAHGSKLISLRFMDKDGAGAVSNSIRAVAYAIDEGANIINNSWGGPDDDPELERVLRFTQKAHGGKGILIVNAAGNESVDNDSVPSYPANWRTKNTISVAAVDKNGQLASFSNWGAKMVDVAAPGVKIYSTAPGSGYQFLSGTSMAAPHVSAVAGLVYGAFFRNGYHPPAEEVKDIIRLTVKKIPSLKGVVSWEGIPNAKDAVLMARMGGMWAQCACTDMIFAAPPDTAQKITIFFSGYKRGTYRAHLTLDVFNDQQVRVDKIRIPFTLVSSRQPAKNKHTDAEVQAAFSDVTKIDAASTEEDSVDLCRLQATFLGLEPLLPQWAIILLAVTGGIVVIAIVIGCAIYLKRRGRRSSGGSPEEQAILPRKAGKLQADDDIKTSAGISSFLSRGSSRKKSKETQAEDVPAELYSHDDAYR